MDPARYNDRDFTAGLKVLRDIRKRPALSMKKFEQNFINKRQLIMIIVGMCGKWSSLTPAQAVAQVHAHTHTLH